jgi:hypothetical protein
MSHLGETERLFPYGDVAMIDGCRTRAPRDNRSKTRALAKVRRVCEMR